MNKTKNVLRSVQQYIVEQKLFSKSDLVLVTLSGGADSVALLRLLTTLGYKCEAAHCNFHLRGEESQRDEDFVTALCASLKVPLHSTHFDTLTYAAAHHISVEMAARDLRYDWFESLRISTGAAVVAVAHHRDDSIETFLLNLIRGSGIDGLCGIKPINGAIVRPLLTLSRNDLVAYLATIDQPFVTDSTNLEEVFKRNKIRLQLLPLLESMNPSVRKTLADTTLRMTDVAAVYHAAQQEAMARVVTVAADASVVISMDALKNEVAPASLLHTLLSPYHFTADAIASIFDALDGQSGKCYYSATHRLIRERGTLILQTLEDVNSLEAPTIEEMLVADRTHYKIPRLATFASLDADKLTLPLTLRKWKQGDWFVPFGMKGKKLVSDYLTDRKYSLTEKENQFVMCSGSDIVWLVGERCDNRFAVQPKTKRILQLKLTK